jgi:hypothetical protein
MKNYCFICSSEAKTDEHVIPKWLQNKYDLWDQRITLPNRTTMPYRQLRIPCCNKCNNEVLSQLEKKVENGKATDQELWKWAAKIHFGLLNKDDFLEWDRKNPGYKIGEVLKPDDPIEINRHLVHSINGAFSTFPDPFGSVFKFHFPKEEPFHFAHLINFPGLCICTGKTGYVIFINDTGSLSRQPSIKEPYSKYLKNPDLGKILNFFANSWVHLYRHEVTYPLIMSRSSIALVGSPKLKRERPFSNEMHQELWRYVTGNPDAVVIPHSEYEQLHGMA